MTPLRHVMILASAGSGKTYALTNRFVALLAGGARPERIVALTFTRKAAGEFFDEILNKLARAASEPAFAARLAGDIGRPELGPADFCALLRATIDAMPRLRLGTLDAFFARIARAFPFELGLTGEFEVLQEHAVRIERRRVLQRLFARAPQGLDAAQREFVEAFKRATFGVEEKQLGARLDTYLDEYQETFLGAPREALWGQPARIWPGGCPWLEPGEKPLADALAALRAALTRRGLTEKQAARWDAFFTALSGWRPGGPLPDPVRYILKNALAVWGDLGCGAAEMVVERKKFPLAPEECRELRTILRHLVCAEFTRQLEMTRGLHAVLRGYDTIYHDAVRRAGKLTFGDVQRLLEPVALTRENEGGAEAEARALFIDYRLDAEIDHWLIDEFQDTSFGQWSILRNLVDEVVQDPTGGRTFFCVGDVKQAIFTWREGDPRLFREIFEYYNRAAPGTIAGEHLVRSWRSGPAIVGMVNAIFGRDDVLAQLFPGPASAAWNREWRAHESARPQLAGHAAWLHAADEAERFALTMRLLHEIEPLERGLTCAVLTPTNAVATRLADYLRREGGIPALAESDLHVCTDNPLGAALLALAQAAAHPGDTLAQEHLAMTPLRAALVAEGFDVPERLTRGVLAQIHATGFERTMEFWLRRLEPALAPGDAFSRVRGRQFVAAAALFDATGSRDVAEFVAFMQRHTVRGVEVAGAVRVMTIHKSKGLGFDVVILPDLEGERLDQRRRGLAVQRAEDRAVEWVLDLPTKLLYEHDEILRAHVRAAEAEACYEALSLFYVALTRAKRAMYAIAKPPGNSESRNYPRILASTLGTGAAPLRIGRLTCTAGWSSGEPEWYERCVAPESTPAEEIDGTFAPGTFSRVARRPSRRPSAQKAGAVPLAHLFALEADAAAELGTDVHALLAQVEWADPQTNAEQVRAWTTSGASAAAMAQAANCLTAPALAAVWRRPPHGDVWRERAFEIVLDGAWVTGVFDRVVLERDAGGRVRRATVFDFKTDLLADEAAVRAAVARHTPQVQVYRAVAAALLRLPRTAIACELVFTRRLVRVPVPG